MYLRVLVPWSLSEVWHTIEWCLYRHYVIRVDLDPYHGIEQVRACQLVQVVVNDLVHVLHIFYVYCALFLIEDALPSVIETAENCKKMPLPFVITEVRKLIQHGIVSDLPESSHGHVPSAATLRARYDMLFQ